MRQYTGDFEPAASQLFDDLWERKLTSVQQVKGILEKQNSFVAVLSNPIDFLFSQPQKKNFLCNRGNAQIYCGTITDRSGSTVH